MNNPQWHPMDSDEWWDEYDPDTDEEDSDD